MDRHVEELESDKAKDNMIIILLLGSLAGCALVFLSVINLGNDVQVIQVTVSDYPDCS